MAWPGHMLRLLGSPWQDHTLGKSLRSHLFPVFFGSDGDGSSFAVTRSSNEKAERCRTLISSPRPLASGASRLWSPPGTLTLIPTPTLSHISAGFWPQSLGEVSWDTAAPKGRRLLQPAWGTRLQQGLSDHRCSPSSAFGFQFCFLVFSWEWGLKRNQILVNRRW